LWNSFYDYDFYLDKLKQFNVNKINSNYNHLIQFIIKIVIIKIFIEMATDFEKNTFKANHLGLGGAAMRKMQELA